MNKNSDFNVFNLPILGMLKEDGLGEKDIKFASKNIAEGESFRWSEFVKQMTFENMFGMKIKSMTFNFWRLEIKTCFINFFEDY